MSNQNVSKTALPLGTIIGKAVSQCAEAQQAAVASMWEYLREVAFDPESPRDVAMLQFDFAVQHKRMKIRLPLISVLPVQYVQIRDVEIDFDVVIDEKKSAQKDTTLKQRTMRTLSKTSPTKLARICPVRLAPSTARKRLKVDSEKNSYTDIRVKIKAGNQDMSSGMARLLELAGSRGIRITPLDEIAET